MHACLARLRHSAQGDRFLQDLSKIGEALKTKPTVILQTLKYKDKSMTVTLQAKNQAILQDLVKQLNKQGVASKLMNTQQHDQYVQIELQLGGQ